MPESTEDVIAVGCGVNRGQIVQLHCLKQIRRRDGGGFTAELDGHGTIDFSRRQAQAFRQWFGFFDFVYPRKFIPCKQIRMITIFTSWKPIFRILSSIAVILGIACIIIYQISRNDTMAENYNDPIRTSLQQRSSGAHNQNSRNPKIKEDLVYRIQQGTIDPEQSWQEIESSGYPSDKSDSLKNNVIRKIAETEGASKALEFLNSHVGPGSLRRRLLWAVFTNACDDLDGAAKALSSLEFPKEELPIALDGIGSSFIEHGRESFDLKSIIGKLPPDAIGTISNSLISTWRYKSGESAVDREGDARQLFEDILSIKIPDEQKSTIVGGVFETLSSQFPEITWKLLNQNPSRFDSFAKNSKETLISSMVTSNPKEAIFSLVKFSGANNDEFIETGAYYLAQHDMADVAIVINSIPGLKDVEASDAFSVGIIKQSLENGDKESAKLWLNNIKDSKKRVQAELLISENK